MRRVALVSALVVAILVPTAAAHLPYRPGCPNLQCILAAQKANLAHAKHVAKHGKGKHQHWSKKAVKWLSREIGETRHKIHNQMGVREAISHVFGSYASQALSVAWCESRYSTTAQNGQYLGLFQMGDYARSLYGHGDTAYAQAKAAYGYFRDSGYGWGPWECKPW